jgi:hypothetical protein
MGHCINAWIQRLLVPAGVVAIFVMLHLGFGVRRTLAILVPIFAMLTLAMVVTNPGPRAKGLMEGLKSRFR